jgi:hypothetical protein
MKNKNTTDTATEVTVTTTKTVAFKIKGIVVEMTVEELRNLRDKLNKALKEDPAPIDWKKIYEDEAKRKTEPPFRCPPYVPHFDMPNTTRPPWMPDIICRSAGGPIPELTRTVSG